METRRCGSVDCSQQGTIVCTRKVISFKPKQGKKAQMSDEYINYRASKEAIDQYKDSPFRAATTALALSIPVVDSLIAGAVSEAPNKAKIALLNARRWGVFLGAATLVNKAANAVIKRVPSMKKFRDEHPAATGLGVLVGSVAVGLKARNPIDNLISKAFDNNIGEKIKNGAKALVKPLDKPGIKNFAEKYVFNPVKNFVESPKGEKALIYGAPVLIGGIIVKEFFDVARAKQKQQKVKHQLEMQRVKSQAQIVQNTVIDKSVISYCPDKSC